MNILFTCAGRRNYLLEYFKKELGSNGSVMAADMQKTAPAMIAADKPFIVPGIYEPNYIDVLLNICKSEKINAVISLNDLELPILASHKERFDNYNVKLLIPSQNVINICFDKWETHKFINSLGYKSPKTFLTLNEAISSIEKNILTFPLVLKPRWGSASIGIEFSNNIKELELAYKLLNLKLSRTILCEASKEDIKHAILIQEHVSGTEYGIDVLNNLNGEVADVCVKEKLAMRAGETDKAVLRNNTEIEKIGFQLGHNLSHIGNLDCDVFEKNGVYYILEMNPRFGGGYPFSQMAGANYPAAIIAWLQGKTFDFSSFKKRYNQIFAKCDKMVKVS